MSEIHEQVGRLEFVQGSNLLSICTGSLVHRNLVLTNAHCILQLVDDPITGTKQHVIAENFWETAKFRPGLTDGSSLDSSTISTVSWSHRRRHTGKYIYIYI